MRNLLPLLPLLLLIGCQSNPLRQGFDAGRDPAADNNAPVAIYTRLGVEYMQRGDHSLALARLNQALERDPDYPPAHDAMGLLLDRLGQADQARDHYRRAVELDPGYSGAHNNYGWFLCRQKEYAAAEREFMAAVANPLYQTPERAYTNAGVCARQAGRPEPAEAHLRKALERLPGYSPALLEMARLSVAQQRFLQGRAFLQRYLATARHTAETLWLGIQIEQALGDHDAAASYRLSLKANYPDSSQARLLEQMEAHER